MTTTMRSVFTVLYLAAGLFAAVPARAIEEYSDSEKQQFMDWCTTSKGEGESVCSCALKIVVSSVAPSALGQFLAGGATGGFSLSQTAIQTAGVVTQAMTSCSNR